MLTIEELKTLAVGDVVETYPLMRGLEAKEPVKLRVVDVGETVVGFVATWFAVTLGRWQASIADDKIIWEIA